MVKLILFEFRKHFLKITLMAVVLLFTAINVAKIYSVHEGSSLLSKSYSSPVWKELYWNMYGEFGGSITNGKIKKLMDIYRPLENQTADHTATTASNQPNTYTGNVYGDYNFFLWCFVNPMKYDYNYKTYAQGVVTAAKDNMDFYKAVGNQYEYRKNAAVANLFQGRSIDDFFYTEMYQYYVQYDFSAFLVLLICLYGLMSVFISEKESEMDTLLLTTKKGGTKTVWAKLISSAAFVCGICLWFWLVDFVAFSVIFGSWDAAAAPLYSLEDFVNASLNLSLGAYVVLSALAKTAGIFVLALVFLLITCFFKNALIPFIINLCIAFVCIYQNAFFSGSGHVLFKVINPFVLVENQQLVRKTEFVSVFGYPLSSYAAALAIAAVWSFLFLGAMMFSVRKNALRRGGGQHVKKHAALDV